MENARKLRLIQVAKEFKVGLNTLADFLRKKGVATDGSPNTQISNEAYALVEKEFGANRSSASSRDSIREKISTKKETISIEEPKPQPKRNIEVRDEIAQQPRILGRVELDKNGNVVKPQQQPKPEAPKPQVEAPKPQEQPKPQPQQQPKPKQQSKPQVEAPKPAEQSL
jgi:translation initiation factor IF-2